MLRSLTGKQWLELEAYKRIHPFRELRADYRAASIVQMIANVNRGKGKAYTLQDFLLKFEAQEKSKQDTLALMKVLAAAYASEPAVPVQVADTAADLAVTAALREQIALARAAMQKKVN